jgi:signal transduction histidine kinase
VTAPEWLDLAIGALQLLLAAVVLRNLRRFGRAFPWLAALMLFFFVRGTQRLYASFTDSTEELLGLIGDLLIVTVLVLLLLGLRNTVRALEFALDEADARAAEYSRALQDYRTLTRHRLANPITVIRAGLSTIRDLDLKESDRESILAAAEEAAAELEQVVLEPQAVRPEERGLQPKPTIPRTDDPSSRPVT